MQPSDIINRHIEVLTDILTGLPTEWNRDIKVIDSWARTPPTFINMMANLENAVTFHRAITSDTPDAAKLLRHIHASLKARTEGVPGDPQLRAADEALQSAVHERLVDCVYTLVRSEGLTTPPATLRKSISDNVGQLMNMHPQYYTLALWWMLPAITLPTLRAKSS